MTIVRTLKFLCNYEAIEIKLKFATKAFVSPTQKFFLDVVEKLLKVKHIQTCAFLGDILQHFCCDYYESIKGNASERFVF